MKKNTTTPCQRCGARIFLPSVDYGYRIPNTFGNRLYKPIAELLPYEKGLFGHRRYAADRIDPNVKFTDEPA